jgi:AraC family ethanolamine operon transcriptional activator
MKNKDQIGSGEGRARADVSSTQPAAPIRQFSYTDADRFRPGVPAVHNEITPMSQAIDAGQAVLDLPGCQLYSLRTFPRLVEGQAAAGCTVVGFTLEDTASPSTFNGWTVDRPFLIIGHGGARYKSFDVAAGRDGAIVFSPAIEDRGWPETTTTFATIAISKQAEADLRKLLLSAFELAAKSPEEWAAASVAFKERLLSAIDRAVATRDARETPLIEKTQRHFALIERVDDYFASHIGKPIYGKQLSEVLGVSLRTLFNATMQYRGMSTQRYIRLKRLWLARNQLLAGEQSIKACALSQGFWRLGDFANAYRAQFGETPSETVARVKTEAEIQNA